MTGFGDCVWVVQWPRRTWHIASNTAGSMKSWWPWLLQPGVPGGPHHNISSVRSGALSLLFFTASSTPSRVSAFSRYSQVFVEWKNKWHDTQILLGFQSLYLQPHLFQITTRVFPTILRDGRLPAIYMVKKVPWDKKTRALTDWNLQSRDGMGALVPGSPAGAFLFFFFNLHF